MIRRRITPVGWESRPTTGPHRLDDGQCQSDDIVGLCRIARVAAPVGGTMRVEALSTQPAAERPHGEVCCGASHDDRYGNLLTIPVTTGTESSQAQIGLSTVTSSQSVLLKTSLAPF